jgi:uncharacterized protein YcaQ
MEIPLLVARQLAISAQGLADQSPRTTGQSGVLGAISRMGYVQIDTISVVERAHHHVLWTRCPDYQPAMLDDLQARERRIFEYWTHAASYVPMADYRYYRARMEAHMASPRARQWREQHAAVMSEVLGRIRQEGALASADFEAPEGFQRGTWWNWKPAKRALEELFTSGEVMVSERRGFQRVYDLAERVLPAGIDTTAPPADEVACFALRQALRAQGILALKDVRWSLCNLEAVTSALDELLAAGEAVRLDIEGESNGGRPFYALADTLQAMFAVPSEKRLHVLSPFDNLIIWRARLKRLFGFDYTLECYLPAEKRRYGYFVLPILWGTSFAGRLDAKAERKGRCLIVRRLMLESGWEDDAFLPALVTRLHEFAAFNGCTEVVLEAVDPLLARDPLQRALNT